MDVIKVLKWISARQRKKYVIDIWGAKGIEPAEALSGKTDRISARSQLSPDLPAFLINEGLCRMEMGGSGKGAFHHVADLIPISDTSDLHGNEI